MGIEDKILNAAIDVPAKHLDKCKDVAVKLHNSTSARFWMALGAIIASLLCGLMVAYLLRDYGKRNIEYFPDMAYSRAGESQRFYPTDPEQESIFLYSDAPIPGEQNDRVPPDGSIYASSIHAYWAPGSGQVVYPYAKQLRELSPEDHAAVKTMANPYATNDDVLARGKRLFRMNCQACHGVDGIGSAPVTKYGVGAPDIPSKSKALTDGEIYHVIARGAASMPAHGSHVNHDDRWKLVRYVRELEKGK
ncbi:MAG: c-type cytochrome [Planctomycetota bacterium]|jgi:mono/diheme cytochrome c family protein